MCFFFHKWGKWEDTSTGKIVAPTREYVVPDRRSITGFYIQQERRCEKCNKVQIRVETV